MSITLYREGLPRIALKGPYGREGMLVGFVDNEGSVAAIVMLDDGSLATAGLDMFRIQFHYDVETDRWVDENESEPEQSLIME